MIHHGDLFDVLPTLEPSSIDACVTDPPYGIGFMGREWDTFTPGSQRESKRFKQGRGDQRITSNNPNVNGRSRSPAISPSQIEYNRSLEGQRGFQAWTERWARDVFRVLKPGAHVLVCGAPRSFHRMTSGLEDAGFEIRDCFSWLYGQGFPKSLNFSDGRGTALKPGWEPIVLARKPVECTTTANVERYGTGALNIDACRIDGPPSSGGSSGNRMGYQRAVDYADRERTIDRTMEAGRWPANVLLDEDAADLLDLQTADLGSGGDLSGNEPSKPAKNCYGEYKGRGAWDAYGDRGGASRFFYVAKPSREERDYGTAGLTARQRDESRKEGNPGGDNPRNRGLQPRGNFHPTVKPVELMRWLVRLVTPPNGTVLDPFTGSGTTGMACRYELREFIGIEREAEYVAIAERRIGAVAPLFHQETRESASATGDPCA